MSKPLKRILIGAAVLVVLVIAGMRLLRIHTKQASPEETAVYWAGELQVEVTYSRPQMKGRTIFGGLVPYDKVWRTGANEPTTFTVNQSIEFGGTPVPAGTYTLWTIPGAETWTVILNSGSYDWGIDLNGDAQREPEADVAKAVVMVTPLTEPVEKFTIVVELDPARLTLAWDRVMVAVPIGS